VEIRTPAPVLPRPVAPDELVPMKFPCTRLPCVLLPVRTTPFRLLAMTLPAPLAVPPMVLPAEFETSTPAPELPRPVAPAALVPMKFPSIRLFTGEPNWLTINTPSMELPEMTFAVSALVPPTVLPDELKISTPLPELARIPVPAALVPMKLP